MRASAKRLLQVVSRQASVSAAVAYARSEISREIAQLIAEFSCSIFDIPEYWPVFVDHHRIGGRSDNCGRPVTYGEAFRELGVDGRKLDYIIWKVRLCCLEPTVWMPVYGCLCVCVSLSLQQMTVLPGGDGVCGGGGGTVMTVG